MSKSRDLADLPAGSGDINIDDGTLFVDASTNRVGIGTSSPAGRVHAEIGSGEVAVIVQGNNSGSSTSGTGSTLAFRGNANSGNPWEIYRENGSSGDLRIAVDDSGTRLEAVSIDLVNQDFRFNSGYGSVATAYGCRAWVNFNGTGTPAIRDDGNVSSITDVSVGRYTVSFGNNMPDANYAAVASAGDSAFHNALTGYTSLTSGSFQVAIAQTDETSTFDDDDRVSVAVFR